MIVKYENRFNMVALRHFNLIDSNVLFTIISKLRDQKNNVIVIDYSSLIKLSKYTEHIPFDTYLKKLSIKLQGITLFKENGDGFEIISLFNSFKADNRERTLSIKVNPEFAYFFNEMEQWTRFSLNEYTSISSTYAQIAFRSLKQYRTRGQFWISIDQMRDFYSVPKSYRTSDINRRVINPIKKELTPYFRNLNIVPTKHGRKITGYNFTWTPERQNQEELKISYSQKLNRSIDNIRFNNHLNDKEKKAALESLAKGEDSTTKATILAASRFLDVPKDDSANKDRLVNNGQKNKKIDPKKDFTTEIFRQRINEQKYRVQAKRYFQELIAKFDNMPEKTAIVADANIKLRQIEMFENGEKI